MNSRGQALTSNGAAWGIILLIIIMSIYMISLTTDITELKNTTQEIRDTVQGCQSIYVYECNVTRLNDSVMMECLI